MSGTFQSVIARYGVRCLPYNLREAVNKNTMPDTYSKMKREIPINEVQIKGCIDAALSYESPFGTFTKSFWLERYASHSATIKYA